MQKPGSGELMACRFAEHPEKLPPQSGLFASAARNAEDRLKTAMLEE
jgi:hypothetical protein